MATTSKTSSYLWDKTKQEFTCCGSKAAWRHKKGCPKNEGDGKLPPE